MLEPEEQGITSAPSISAQPYLLNPALSLADSLNCCAPARFNCPKFALGGGEGIEASGGACRARRTWWRRPT
jgi:hypothetical protein